MEQDLVLFGSSGIWVGLLITERQTGSCEGGRRSLAGLTGDGGGYGQTYVQAGPMGQVAI